MIQRDCPMCGAALADDEMDAFIDGFVAHVAADHADLPYPEANVRAFGAGLARMTGSAERLERIGVVEVHRVTDDRVDDWLELFDHRVMVGHPENASCYCLEAHEVGSGAEIPYTDWQARRSAMAERLRAGTTVGYLAYVDGVAAGWVNASARCHYSLFNRGDDGDATTAAIACFAIAPPYRGHGLAATLLAHVVADAAHRGVDAVEAYPFPADDATFRGSRRLYDAAGFTEVAVRERDVVVRLEVEEPPS